MGRTNRRKKRTHQDVETETTAPKSFVIERGKVGTTLHHLVLDLRRVMEPNTATKLKVRHKNVVKDFIQVAGPLGCTHMMILSRTESYINLRVCKLPRGPTITFHIKAFTLCHEVVSSLKKPAVNAKQFLTPALLILNNFSPESKPLTLMTSLFQNMFPSVNIHKVKLSEIRRCVLLNYIADTNTIEFRHYNIKATPQGVSRGIKKLVHSHVPDLGKYTDISDLVLGGNVSESEGEELVGGEGAEVTLPQDLPGRGNIKSEQSAIRLTELGPRLTLQLVKVESGLCGGEVLHHEFIQKTKREAKELKTRVEGQRRLKEKRRSEQERNIQRKIKEKELHRQRCLEGQKGDLQDGEEDGEEEKGEEEKGDDDDDDDAEWYKQEVGEEPDPELFGTKRRRGHESGAHVKRVKWDTGAAPRGRRGAAGASFGRGRGAAGASFGRGRGAAGASFGRGRGAAGASFGRGRGAAGASFGRGRGAAGASFGRGRGGGSRWHRGESDDMSEATSRGRRRAAGTSFGRRRGGMVRGDGDNMSETRGWSSQWSEDSKPQMKFTKPSHKTRHSVGQVKRAGGRVFRKKVT
ncbi:hypothetical protein EMCRGX_G021122 [Ephydatia muelleri]